MCPLGGFRAPVPTIVSFGKVLWRLQHHMNVSLQAADEVRVPVEAPDMQAIRLQ